MVCPLRFVLVGLSAVVAAIGMYYTFWCEDAPQSAEEKRREAERAKLPWWKRVWSLFNGRYLYDEWDKRKARLAAAEKAGGAKMPAGEPWCPAPDIEPANPQGAEGAAAKAVKVE